MAGSSKARGATDEEIPYEALLQGLRYNEVPALVQALRDRDPAVLGDLLRDRDAGRVAGALRGTSVDAAVAALLGDDPAKRDRARRARDLDAIASAIEDQSTGETPPRSALRLAEAVRARDPVRLAAALRGRDPGEAATALRAGDDARAALLLFRARPATGTGRGAGDRSSADVLAAALPDDLPRLRRIADRVESVASRLRGARRLAVAFRGRDPARVVAMISVGDPEEFVAGVRDRDPGRPMSPLPARDARRVAEAIAEDLARAARLSVAARDTAAREAVGPLGPPETLAILDALAAVDLEALGRAMTAGAADVRNAAFAAILPRVAAAARRGLGLATDRPTDEAQSVALSVARVILTLARGGRLREYDLETSSDLAAVFVAIAYQKCRRRLRLRYRVILRPLSGGAGEPAAEVDDWLAVAIRVETAAGVRQELDRFREALKDPVDRVIFRERMNEGRRATKEQIVKTVRDECGCRISTRSVQRHLNEGILPLLRGRLERFGD